MLVKNLQTNEIEEKEINMNKYRVVKTALHTYIYNDRKFDSNDYGYEILERDQS